MTNDPIPESLETIEEEVLVGRVCEGDPLAFEAFVRRLAPLIRAYVRRMMGANAHIDDVVQETFIAAWEHLAELETPGKVRAWLIRIASHKAVDAVRASQPMIDIESVEPPAPDHSSPAQLAEARAEVQVLGDALSELPVAQRECWVLRELGGFSYEEIAAELTLPVSTVRGLLARARKHLVVRMEQWR